MNVYLLRKSFIFFLLIIFSCTLVTAQVARDPNGIEWKQINTELARVVYPAGQFAQAARVMQVMERMQSQNSASIGPKTRRITVTLHDQTIISNGSVSTFPYESNFFMTAPQSPQFIGTGDWMDLLAIHEFRHVQQDANINVGLTRALRIFLGDAGVSTTGVLAIPNWFKEGDAVVMETAMTPAGRGRMPSFSLEQRAGLMNGKLYPYMKARNGSLKDWVPGHYPMGYTLCAYARDQFGNDIWKKVYRRASGWQGLFYPFSRGLKKETGLRTKELYKVAYEAAQKEWEAELAEVAPSPVSPVLSERSKGVQFYRFPIEATAGQLLCWRSGYDRIPGLYKVADGKAKKLLDIGATAEPFLSVKNSVAVWTELNYDPRYEFKNYSEIVYYDIDKGKRLFLKRKTKYFSPDVSADGKKIVAVNVTSSQDYQLHFLHYPSASLIDQYDNPENYIISFPKFTTDESAIVFIARKNSQAAILELDLSSKKIKELTPWTSGVIADPFVHDDQVFFTASFSGIDNIYSVSRNTPGDLVQHSNVLLGAYQPSVAKDGKTLYFSNAEEQGIFLAQLPLSATKPKSLVSLSATPLDLSFANRFVQEEGLLDLDKVTPQAYEEKKFKGFFSGFKFYAWYPLPDISNPLFSIEGQNNLRTTGVRLGLGYNINEKQFFYTASLQRSKGPIISRLRYQQQQRSVLRLNSAADSLIVENFSQDNLGLNFSLPLTFYNGPFVQELTFNLGADRRWLSNRNNGETSYADYALYSGSMTIQFANIKRRARQQVAPRWGQTFSFQVQNVLSTDDPEASRNQFTFQLGARLFFPGFHRNHSLSFDFAQRREDFVATYQFNTGFRFNRGMPGLPSDQFTRYSVDYQLPLFYPDWGFAGITYFRRVRANLFYDLGFLDLAIGDTLEFESLRSQTFGVELLSDNSVLNVGEISLGVRYSYIKEDPRPELFVAGPDQYGKHRLEFLLTSPF